ncbi:MAG: hypothetical protein ACK583_07525, partial [Cyanobacteriota bacterium]
LRDARSGSLSGTDAPLPEEELGFYDAADPDVLRLQATLAARHGLYGLCFLSLPMGSRCSPPIPLKASSSGCKSWASPARTA